MAIIAKCSLCLVAWQNGGGRRRSMILRFPLFFATTLVDSYGAVKCTHNKTRKCHLNGELSENNSTL